MGNYWSGKKIDLYNLQRKNAFYLLLLLFISVDKLVLFVILWFRDFLISICDFVQNLCASTKGTGPSQVNNFEKENYFWKHTDY